MNIVVQSPFIFFWKFIWNIFLLQGYYFEKRIDQKQACIPPRTNSVSILEFWWKWWWKSWSGSIKRKFQAHFYALNISFSMHTPADWIKSYSLWVDLQIFLLNWHWLLKLFYAWKMAKMEWDKHKVNRWEFLTVQTALDPENKVIRIVCFRIYIVSRIFKI